MKKRKIFFLCLIVLLRAGIPLSSAEEKCGIENCHGMDIQCGPNIAEQCTMMYAFGDRCRAYAQCQILDGRCALVESKQYKDCIDCVKACEEMHKGDMPQAFACEGSCG
jgi:hypothetical protein